MVITRRNYLCQDEGIIFIKGTVNKNVQRVNGEIVINTPKTKSSIRTIKFCDECVNLLVAFAKKAAG